MKVLILYKEKACCSHQICQNCWLHMYTSERMKILFFQTLLPKLLQILRVYRKF